MGHLMPCFQELLDNYWTGQEYLRKIWGAGKPSASLCDISSMRPSAQVKWEALAEIARCIGPRHNLGLESMGRLEFRFSLIDRKLILSVRKFRRFTPSSFK